MSTLEALVERAKQSELFTAPRLAADLDRFLDHTRRPGARDRPRGARGRRGHRLLRRQRRIVVGDVLGQVPVRPAHDAAPPTSMLSYELVWRTPRRLGPGSIVFVASYSGGTEDTLAALRHARDAGARTVALVRSADSTIGREADVCIAYEATALYALPMAAVTLFALEWARLEGNGGCGRDRPPDWAAARADRRVVRARSRAGGEPSRASYLPSQILYGVGAGPLYGLAYKFALTVFMENIRTHGSIIESAEFRHGPAEMLERQRPDMVVPARHRRVAGPHRALARRRTDTGCEHVRVRRGRLPGPAPAALALRAEGAAAVVRRLLGAASWDRRPRRARADGTPRARRGRGDVAVSRARVACVGDNCIDRYIGDDQYDLPGGNALNVAVRLGADYYGAVGDDDEGRTIVEQARAAGVGIDGIDVHSGPKRRHARRARPRRAPVRARGVRRRSRLPRLGRRGGTARRLRLGAPGAPARRARVRARAARVGCARLVRLLRRVGQRARREPGAPPRRGVLLGRRGCGGRRGRHAARGSPSRRSATWAAPPTPRVVASSNRPFPQRSSTRSVRAMR